MSDNTNWMVHDHRKYETALDECELAAGAGAWKEAVRVISVKSCKTTFVRTHTEAYSKAILV